MNQRSLVNPEGRRSMWHPRMRRVTDLVSSGEVGAIRNFLGTFTFDGVPDGGPLALKVSLDPRMLVIEPETVYGEVAL